MTSAPVQICKPETSKLQNIWAALYSPTLEKKRWKKKAFAENSKLFLYGAFVKKKVPNPVNHDYNFTCYVM